MHSPTNIWLATLESWLDPALHHQIVKFEWRVVWTGQSKPYMRDLNHAGLAHARQKAARRLGRSKRCLAKKGRPKAWVEEATAQRRSRRRRTGRCSWTPAAEADATPRPAPRRAAPSRAATSPAPAARPPPERNPPAPAPAPTLGWA